MPSYVPKNAPVYFHRVGPDENFDTIAAKYNVSAQAMINQIGLTQPQEGDVVVVNIQSGTLEGMLDHQLRA